MKSDDGSIYAAAAKDNKTAKILLTFFENGSAEQNKEVIIKLKNLGLSGNINYTCTKEALDENNNDCASDKTISFNRSGRVEAEFEDVLIWLLFAEL